MLTSKRFRTVSIVIVLIALAIRFAASAQDNTQLAKPSTIRIAGAVEKPREWTPDQLKTEFAADIKTVPYTLKGVKGEAQCLPLLTLIQAAKLKLSPKPKNHELAVAIVVKGSDGYAACFSYGELQPQIGKRAVWLALDRGGKPLPEAAAPAELLSTDDDKPSRWVHAISSITVIDGVQATEGK
jgi:hypothetical protein